MKKPSIVLIWALGACLCAAPTAVGGTLFTDFGPGYSVDNGHSWAFYGAGSALGHSLIQADQFTVAGSGSQTVTQIDVSVGYGAVNTFSLSIWTSVGGSPGSQVSGASWGLTTNCQTWHQCAPVSVTGVTGVTLSGGQQYFLLVGPQGLNDTTSSMWNQNNQGVTGTVQRSNDGGLTWLDSASPNTLAGFDVLGNPAGSSVPEPGTLSLLWGALAAAGVTGFSRRGWRSRSR